MYAAVVRAFDSAPRYETYPVPRPTNEDEVLIDVVASGLHPRVRSQAAGSHYTSTDDLPLVPGIDGVGRLATGGLVYFILPDTTMGAMAQQTVIDTRRSIALPGDTDAVLVAAGMNPAMSSWIAFRERITFTQGQKVLVLGATGSAGQMAVQIAKHFGAARVIGAGRDVKRLEMLAGLGADEVVSLTGNPEDVAARLGRAASDVDVVIDYLWGKPAQDAMVALAMGRADRAKQLNWVQIGSVAGPTAQIPSTVLRAANLRIVGSGQGSVSTHDILGELPELAAHLVQGTFTLNVKAEPLERVERVWTEPIDPDQRVVILP